MATMRWWVRMGQRRQRQCNSGSVYFYRVARTDTDSDGESRRL